MWSDEDEKLPHPTPTSRDDAVLLKVEEAAARLGIARTSMFKLIRIGEVRSVQVGRLRRVPVVCLDEYVERLLGAPDGPNAA